MYTIKKHRHRESVDFILVKMGLLGLFVVFFGILFVSDRFVHSCEEKIKQDIKQYQAQVKILEVKNFGELFPQRYRAICYDSEMGFLFIQDYHLEKRKPKRTQNLMLNYETQLTKKLRCDEYIEQIASVFDARYFTQYDPDLNGFCLFTTETDTQRLLRLVEHLQTLPKKNPVFFSIIICSENIYKQFENADMRKIMNDPALVLNDAGYQRGVCMMIFGTEGSCSWVQDETNAVDTLQGIRIEYNCNEDTSYVIELDGKISSDETSFRVWKIN